MSVAKYILIVEKESGQTFLRQTAIFIVLNLNVNVMDYLIGFDAVFQRLANDQFCKRNQCIVITVSLLLIAYMLVAV